MRKAWMVSLLIWPCLVPLAVWGEESATVRIEYHIAVDRSSVDPTVLHEYKGSIDLPMKGETRFGPDAANSQMVGMPIHRLGPDSTMIEFKKHDGKKCFLSVAAQGGMVTCQDPSAKRDWDNRYVATEVVRTGGNTYRVTASEAGRPK
jgi:hypothetical protein